MNDPRITEAVELMKSRDLKKRMAALDVAAGLDGREALALLLKALHDQSWTLREYAIPKLIAKGPRAVVPILRHLTSGVWFTRAALAQVLEKTGDHRAAPALFLMLPDSNKSVVEASQKALSAITSRADPEKLAAGAAVLAPAQRELYLGHLRREFKDQPKKLSLIPVPEKAAADEGKGDQRSGAGASLQSLRKAFKAALKQSTEIEYDAI